MIALVVPDAPRTGIVRMAVAVAVVAVLIMRATVPSAIGAVVVRTREIEMVVVGVGDINPESPIDRKSVV